MLDETQLICKENTAAPLDVMQLSLFVIHLYRIMMCIFLETNTRMMSL